MRLKIFSGTANPDLARRMVAALNLDLGAVEIMRFPDQEIFVKFTENIRGADVFLIQPTCRPPAENLFELLIMIDAARRASAQRITAVLPYYGFARQDRKDQPRVPITAKLVANLLVEAGADRILTMDLHAQQIQGFFDIPVDHLYAAPVLIAYLRRKVRECPVVVAPDSGGVKMAHGYAQSMNAGLAIVAKRRLNASEVATLHMVGDVEGRDCILVDDLTTTAGTLAAAAERLRQSGAGDIYAAVSHCCLLDDGYRKLDESPITQMVTTDTVPADAEAKSRKVKVLSVADLLAEAIRRIHEGQSVSSLFRYAE